MSMVFRLHQLLNGKDKEETEDFNDWKSEMNEAIEKGEFDKLIPKRNETL